MKRLFFLATKAWLLYRANGTKVLARRAWRYVRRRGLRGILLDQDNAERFQRWLRIHAPSRGALDQMRIEAAAFANVPVIDVIMPVCDPEPRWLEAAVRSVQEQVYPHWHLCIADDASRRPEIQGYLERIATEDPRITVTHRDTRGGISATTNTALALATGEFACFLDHDDELTPHALHQVVEVVNKNPDIDLIYSDECSIDCVGNRKSDPSFKPGFSPDLLMSMNFIGHLVACRYSLLQKVGGLRTEFDGSQDYDLLLRLAETTRRIQHIPDILYYWRRSRGSTAGDADAKPYAYTAAVCALTEAVQRRGLEAEVTMQEEGRYRTRYIVKSRPLVSIVIPTKDRKDLLETCIASIEQFTAYERYEVVVMDNGSTDRDAVAYLKEVGSRSGCRVIQDHRTFNWSALNNRGATAASGEFLLFLNNDIRVRDKDWLTELVAHGQRQGIGAVGAKLVFPNGNIQHAGVTVGMGGVAGHPFYGCDESFRAPLDATKVVRNVSAVTGACMLTKRSVFDEVGGFDEDLDIAYNDVDYCLRIGARGYHVVWTPYAVLEHSESATRKGRTPLRNENRFLARWGGYVDFFTNPNLDIDDVRLRIRDSLR